MLKFKVHLIIITLIAAFQFNLFAQEKINWNGYLQFRFSDDYYNQAGFSIRRAKLWLNGSLPTANNNWSYKLQANFFQQSKYQFLLQDVYVKYSTGFFEAAIGQFVTDFSLQRKQSDYLIPLVERAAVINALVPASETMARDIGVEAKLILNNNGSFSLGFFNGNGANNFSTQKEFSFCEQREIVSIKESKTEIRIRLQPFLPLCTRFPV